MRMVFQVWSSKVKLKYAVQTICKLLAACVCFMHMYVLMINNMAAVNMLHKLLPQRPKKKKNS